MDNKGGLVLSCIHFLFKYYYNSKDYCSVAFNKSNIDTKVNFVA